MIIEGLSLGASETSSLDFMISHELVGDDHIQSTVNIDVFSGPDTVGTGTFTLRSSADMVEEMNIPGEVSWLSYFFIIFCVLGCFVVALGAAVGGGKLLKRW